MSHRDRTLAAHPAAEYERKHKYFYDKHHVFSLDAAKLRRW